MATIKATVTIDESVILNKGFGNVLFFSELSEEGEVVTDEGDVIGTWERAE